MFEAYSRIFTRMKLRFRAVRADTGSIGGSASQEFHVLADSGEDAIAFASDSDYAANVELASAAPSERLADELGDLKIELVRAQHDESTPLAPPQTDPRLADRLTSIAERIEGIATSLDRP